MRTLAVASSASATGVPALLAGVLLVESGVPVPIPADVLVLITGERAAAGAVPLWLAAVAMEVVAVLGTTLLFAATRGPARTLLQALVQRVGPRPRRFLGGDGAQQRHPAALALGRATPGLRTLTVVVSALAGMRPRIAIPALVVGSTVFLQGHLLLGWALGPAAESLLGRARVAVVVVLVALAALAAVTWLRRRGRTAGERGLAEAGCPACLALAAARGVLVR
jgi:membrane protein DedA with SNARE-associated domain